MSPIRFHFSLNGYHGGRDLGMRSHLICIPDLDVAVIVFANSEHINAESVAYKVLDLWIPELAKNEKEQEKFNLKKEKLNELTGYYQELNSDLRMHIFVNNDTLNALSSFGRDPVKLSATSNTSFSRIDNASVNYTFLSSENSEADLLVDFGGAVFYFERISLATEPNENISEYSCKYFSEEINVTYEFVASEKELILNYPSNEGIVVKEGEKDVFGSNRRTKYTFSRDDKNKVNSFYAAAEGTVKNILFKKID